MTSQQRFAAANAEFAHAKFSEDAYKTLDLFEGEQILARQELVLLAEDFRRHAVGAAEIAAIGHGNAQIAQRAIAGINWSVLGGKNFHGFGVGACTGFG